MTEATTTPEQSDPSPTTIEEEVRDAIAWLYERLPHRGPVNASDILPELPHNVLPEDVREAMRRLVDAGDLQEATPDTYSPALHVEPAGEFEAEIVRELPTRIGAVSETTATWLQERVDLAARNAEHMRGQSGSRWTRELEALRELASAAGVEVA